MNMEQLLLAGSEGQDLKRQRGRRSTKEEGSKRSLAHSHTLRYAQVQHTHTHAPHMARTHTDKTTYHMNNKDATRRTVNTQSFHSNKFYVLDA